MGLRYLVGTSGWQYESWRGVLYPDDLAKGRWLAAYGAHFDTVECNAAFYRLPDRRVFEGWRERTGEGFVMAVKASRFLTHVRRLRDPAEPVARLVDHARGLGDHLGPILLQLPPDFTAVPDRLDACLAEFPPGVRIAVEPRHDSWWIDETRSVLQARGAALCWADRYGRPLTPLWRTARWGYLRLHEGAATPWPRYGERALRSWIARAEESWRAGDDLYVYFNNDPGGAAVHDARAFLALAASAAS